VKSVHLLSSILLAVSSNLDNLGVAITFGLRKVQVPWAANLLIAVLTGLGTLLSMKAGGYVTSLLPPFWSNLISSVIMVSVGVWVMFQSWGNPKAKEGSGTVAVVNPIVENAPKTIIALRIKTFEVLIRILEEPNTVDQDHSGNVDLKEATLLGAALSLNNIAGGIGGGMAGLKPELTALFATMISFIFFEIGVKFGKSYFTKCLGDRASQLAGAILIAIGIYEFFI
jgi:putative sporulation protein YtaF